MTARMQEKITNKPKESGTKEMKKVTVNCTKTYSMLIENGIMAKAGELIKEHFGNKRFCVITDENVGNIYLDRFSAVLAEAGLDFDSYVFPAGERHKTMSTVEDILAFLAERHYTRSDMLIALGGGIVGDVTGFAAAIYQRGIEFVQMPTTVLAAVDSSVGGKTGVNLGGLKNQVGAFWQPSLVLCDPESFKTLPAVEYSSGMAEVVKYAAICRASLADMIEAGKDISDIICECVSIKRDIVQRDERDTGERQLLNLGHTFGHAVEKVTANAFTHGQAVSIGTVMAFKAAEKMGICSSEDVKRISELLARFNLPLSCDCTFESLLSAMQSDKKRVGAEITLVLPRCLGECVLHTIEMSALPEVLASAM